MPVYLPSTTALRALDAIARLGSVAAAAAELNLTRGAVSHQIRTLEQCVGFALTAWHFLNRRRQPVRA